MIPFRKICHLELAALRIRVLATDIRSSGSFSPWDWIRCAACAKNGSLNCTNCELLVSSFLFDSERLIGEMFRSDRSRPLDYERAVVVDAERQRKQNKTTLRSEGEVCSEKAQNELDRVSIVRDVRLMRVVSMGGCNSCSAIGKSTAASRRRGLDIAGHSSEFP